MAMMRHPLEDAEYRAHRTRKWVLGAAVAGAILVAGGGTYMYVHNHSANALTRKGTVALNQHDTRHAIDYFTQAIRKNPGGELGTNVHNLLAQALIEDGREEDARPYAQEVLAADPHNTEALDNLAESYIHPALRRYRTAIRPLTLPATLELLGIIDANIASLQQLPKSARNLTAEAELDHLYSVIDDEGRRSIKNNLDMATAASDQTTIAQSQQDLAKLTQDPAAREALALARLDEAAKLDPKDPQPPKLLAQYRYLDHQYPEALAVYRGVVKAGGQKAVSQDLAIVAANASMADRTTEPDKDKRFAAAQAVLQDYLKESPNDAKVVVALGQVMLERGNNSGAADMATKAMSDKVADVDAQILMVNVLLREKKTAEAIKMLTPLTSKYAGVPQVWYLLGLAMGDTGDYRAAGDALQAAIARNPNYGVAKQALLAVDVQAGRTAEAQQLATQINREDRYFMPAWAVTCDNLRQHGQEEQARKMLISLAADPDLPAESKPDLVALLISTHASAAAEELLKSLPPDEPATERLRAQNAVAAGNLNEARTLLAAAVKGDPGNVAQRLEYASLLATAGLSADARVQLNETAAMPLTPEESLRLARGYLTLRLPEQASAVLKKVLDAHPTQAEALALKTQADALTSGTTAAVAPVGAGQATPAETLRLAQQALDAKDAAKALTIARNGLAKDPTNWRLHLIAGNALAALDKTDQAVEEIVAAVAAQPNGVQNYEAFVALFPTAEKAMKGIGFAGRLEAANGAMADWAMGKLSETSGQADMARKYYLAGLDAVSRLMEPRPARDALYSALLSLDATRKDSATLRNDADSFASKDNYFAAGIRLSASDKLAALGDRAGAQDQLDSLTAILPKDASPRLVLTIMQRRLNLDQPEKARALLEPRVAASDADPDLLAAYAALIQDSDPAKALQLRQTLVSRDPQDPTYRIALAQTLAAAGDEAAAFAALDDAAKLGQTGKDLAAAARLRYLISMGLLKAAADDLATVKDSTQDFSSLLAVGRGWEELHQNDAARKALAAIPSYAGEYPAAQIALAAMDTEAGKTDASVKELMDLSNSSAAAAQQASIPLFHTLVFAGKASVAMELARSQRAQASPNSPEWRNWTLLAALAAREGKDYQGAIQMLEALDTTTQAANSLDIALLRLLQDKGPEALTAAASLADTAPAYDKTFVTLAAGGKPEARVLADGMPSVVLADIAATPPAQRAAALQATAKNPHLFTADLQTLLTELGDAPDSTQQLLNLALGNRTLESGWSTATLDLVATPDAAKPLTAALILRHQALTGLRRTAEADKLRDALAQRFNQAHDGPPTVRVLLAASWGKEGRYSDALAILQPLEATGRPDILTALATLEEKLGRLDDAIALHRKVRAADPNDVVAANNLAYTLAAAHPDDKAVLAEAKKNIEFAISKAPQVTVFQDTLGWIEIQSGQSGDGVKRIAKALPSLRLDPAVHYHLGMGYARTGQPVLARMHLQNVAALAGDTQDKTAIPELALASAALKTLPQ